MADALQAALSVAASGLHAQSKRLRVVSENLANAQSTGVAPGEEPFSRKVISFAQTIDDVAGVSRVKIAGIEKDETPFRIVHDPGHPAADDKGNVRLPNVNMLSEVADMKEASRSYEANLQVVQQARDMIMATIDLLRSGR